MDPVIELDGLEVRFGQRVILKKLKAALTGRSVGLLGPNGAGKSTLINTLLGFHKPSAGTARDRGDLHILLSSHLLHDVEDCCDQVLILKDGNVAAFCNLEEERSANRRFLELETRGGNNGDFLAAVVKLGCETAPGVQGRIKLVMPEGLDVRQLYEIAAGQNVQI